MDSAQDAMSTTRLNALSFVEIRNDDRFMGVLYVRGPGRLRRYALSDASARTARRSTTSFVDSTRSMSSSRRTRSVDLAMPSKKSVCTSLPNDGASSIWASAMSDTSDTRSTITPVCAPCTCTTMMQFSADAAASSMPNLARRSTIGITLPRRLMTPRTNEGVRGTRVMGITPMISWTFRISSPYSSRARKKVRYLPARFPVRCTVATALVSFCMRRAPGSEGSARVARGPRSFEYRLRSGKPLRLHRSALREDHEIGYVEDQ